MTDPIIASDDLVPDPVVQREFGVSAMTIWRWDHDPELLALGWPLPVRIRRRNYRPRRAIEKFKGSLIRRAVAERSEHRGAQPPAQP